MKCKLCDAKIDGGGKYCGDHKYILKLKKNGGNKMTKCPICGGNVKLGKGTIKSELLACSECGAELEVIGIKPFKLAKAPKEEEDWGE